MTDTTPSVTASPRLPSALDGISLQGLADVLTQHRRNDVIEPDHSPGGSLSRTRIKCENDACDFYGVYDTWFAACRAFEEHLAEVLHQMIVAERGDALRQAAHHYGAVWGSGVTTEENVAMVLSWWADHGVGARIDPNRGTQPVPASEASSWAGAPKRFTTYAHADGRTCLFNSGWSWTAFSGDEQSAVRIACDRDHP